MPRPAVVVFSILSSLDGDRKVINSVGRILSIWEERAVYSGSLITGLKSTLIKAESPPETPVEQKSKSFSRPVHFGTFLMHLCVYILISIQFNVLIVLLNRLL